MLLLAGLGNPGYRYALTRHNVGFWVIDYLSRELKIPLQTCRRQFFMGRGSYLGCELLLMKPLTFMNRSGLPVAKLAQEHKIALQDVLVIHDDLDLPLGKIRLKGKGGSGGHNGIQSIIFHLQSENFKRLKIGIGRPPTTGDKQVADTADYVLTSFGKEEEEVIEEAVSRAVEAVLHFIAYGLNETMNKFN